MTPSSLLIVTQAVDANDPILGFFVRWIEEFSKNVKQVTVICLFEGTHELPANVAVYSLGKERGRVSRVRYALRFWRYLWKLRQAYDAVFVHMNPEYVFLGGLLWRVWGKRIGLWYTHKRVDLKLRIAERLVHVLCTASPEGLRIRSPKVQVMGHGIDTALFAAPVRPVHTPLRIVSVGRITPIKNLDTLVRAVALLIERGVEASVTFIGPTVYRDDESYQRSLTQLAEELGVSKPIMFLGSVPHAQMPQYLREFDVSINLAPTGGMDKAVLESMAAGLLVLTSNQAFRELLGKHARHLLVPERDASAVADRLATYSAHFDQSTEVRRDVQQAVGALSVASLIARILPLLR